MTRCARCNAEPTGGTIAGVCPVCLIDTALPEQPSRDDGAFRYDLIEEIGRGGMGVVYRAVQHGSKRQVAVKMILAEQAATPGMLERFHAEVEAIASLDHPNILPIYETGEVEDTPFYSMRLASGGTLRQCIPDFPADPRRAAKLIATLARAVHHAHERGILHRDLKPGNVLLDGPERMPFVSDFGLAKWLGRENRLTLATSALGTPHYIAPEQAAGASKKLTPAADVYSLGAILYELLVGRPPFLADTPLETLRLAVDTPPPAPRSWNASISRDLELICLKCLAKEPSARYHSAAALADDLDRWLGGRTVVARPSTPIERTWRWIRRNPAIAGLSAALLVVLLSVVIALFGYEHATPAREANPGPPAKSIAVLPFENLSDDANSAYFAQGVQDEILTRLSKMSDLKVISHTSTQHYKSVPENLADIARQLGVAHILQGSVQKSGDAVRVNVQLIKVANDSNLWVDTFDRKLTDIFSVESEVAKAIADRLRVKLTGQEEQVIDAKPTDNPQAYDAYLRGLAYTLRIGNTQANSLAARKYLQEAVRLDPKFALAWALLSDIESRGYVTQALQPTLSLREEARQAAETALTLQPNLGEALLAKGNYYYACLKDYDAAVRYFEQARQFLPNSSRIPQSLAYVARRRGQWDRSESYFKEAERLDPRNVYLLSSHAGSYIILRRFEDALRKLDQILNITPDDVDTVVTMAGIAQAQGDLSHASLLLAPLRPTPNLHHALQTQVYQAVLERRPAEIIARLTEIVAQPDPALGFYNGELRFYLGWAQEVAGDEAAAQESWRQARNELEPFLKEQPENYHLLGDLALTNMGLGDKAAALSFAKHAMAVIPIEKDAMDGPWPMEILARVAARMGEPDRAITALEKLLSIPYEGPLATTVVPLTPALLRLDPMFDPLRNDPRFKKLADKIAPRAPEKSIAVLPFVDLSQTKDQEYFCDGISEEILDTLAKTEGLRVVARTSSFSFKGKNADIGEIAQKLNVQNVLEGSVRREGNRIRITAQLVDAHNGFRIWSDTFERELQGIFAVQDEITRAIVDALKIKLAVAPTVRAPQNTEAYDLYLQGLYLSNKSDEESLRKSLGLFQRALEIDPNFARAWTGVSKAWMWLSDAYVEPLKAGPRWEEAALKALALDEHDAEALSYLSEAKRVLRGDLAGEDADLRRALEIDPNSGTAYFFLGLLRSAQGRSDEAVAAMEHARSLDPLSPIVSRFTSVIYFCGDELDKAVAEGERTAQLDPNYVYFESGAGFAYREKGEFDKAIAVYKRDEQILGTPSPGLAVTYVKMGKEAEARAILAQLLDLRRTRYFAADSIAEIYAALGEKDEAFRWLDRAVAEHSAPIHGIGVRPEFRSVRSDPRFAEILRRIGLNPSQVLQQ